MTVIQAAIERRIRRIRDEQASVLRQGLDAIKAPVFMRSIVAKVWAANGFQAALAVVDAWKGEQQ